MNLRCHSVRRKSRTFTVSVRSTKDDQHRVTCDDVLHRDPTKNSFEIEAAQNTTKIAVAIYRNS